MNVAIQGQAGSFHEQIAKQWYGDSVTIVPVLIFAMPSRRARPTRCHYDKKIAQCRKWLLKHLPNAELVELFDTAEAVEFIKKEQAQRMAAIAGAQAATLLGEYVADNRSHMLSIDTAHPGE